MNRRKMIALMSWLGTGFSSLIHAQANPSSRTVISRDGTRIAYTVTGTGTDVVLLHGLMGNRQSWYSSGYVDALSNHRLILVDMRGHGESEGPTDVAAYSYANLTADIAAVVEMECAPPPARWGSSAGGGLARACVALYPALYRKFIVRPPPAE